ncbi:MAG: hypothetical protein RLZZ312_1679 [Bacteroidota bacterium]|jgi:uncharacterized protein (TIGR02453 family)
MLQPTTLSFLDDLRQNNNREWFQENKKQYELFKKDYHNLINLVLTELKKTDSSLEMVQTKDCAFRINRDIRFSKNKSPYKTHLAIGISADGKKNTKSSYYIHIEPNACFVGGGLYCPEPQQLAKIRKEIAFFYDDLQTIIGNPKFKKAFNSLSKDEGQFLKNPPKGYEKDHPAIEFLKLKSFTAGTTFDEKDALKPDFVSKMVDYLRIIKPFNDFLNRAVEEIE